MATLTPALDLRSLTLMSFMMSLALGFVILMLRRHYPASIRGMRLWGWAPLSAASSTVLFGLEHWFTPLVVVVIGNGLLMLGCALFYFGSRQFYGLRTSWLPWGLAGAAVLLWHAYFLVVHPDYRVRLVVFTTTLAVMLIAHVRLLLLRGRGFAARFTASVLAVQTAVLLVRAATTFWLDSPDTQRFAPSLIQSAYVAAYSFSVLLVSMGLLLMASDRLRFEFEHLANHDSLTGALTRRAVLAAGAQEFDRWQRYQHGFALLMIDVDLFKQINDRYGHASGDRVLERVVDSLSHELRTVDRLGRYGGEEFLVLLPDTRLDDARLVAERMRLAVAQRPAAKGLPACAVSVGVASVQAGDLSLDAVLARADAALYHAKRRGRNRVETDAGPVLRTSVSADLGLTQPAALPPQASIAS
jgi:diguanylate cyclase (GGDEF)-like protein